MTKPIRELTLDALTAHAQGHIDKHVANVEIMLSSPVGVAEHSNMLETIEAELKIIAEYMDQIEVIDAYFGDDAFDDDPEPEAAGFDVPSAQEDRPAKNFKLRHSA